MSPFSFATGTVYPRGQADRLAELLSQPASCFRGVVAGKRGEGKTDLLRQLHAQLFERAEGPIPFYYSFQREDDRAAEGRRFLALFCQQVRAFLMRREELLWEPGAQLEQELERPGLPLSLTELARSLEKASPGGEFDVAAALPAQFAYRERRPVCLLLDDVHELGRAPAFLAALPAAEVCWLLSGRSAFVRRMAGEKGWPLVPVEPLSQREALSLAEKKCHACGMKFVKEVWGQWFAVAGTSARLADLLITTAAVGGLSLDTPLELGRVYVRELSNATLGGTLGNELSARWRAAVPEREQRARVAGIVQSLDQRGLPAEPGRLPAAVWEGLIEQEWAEEMALAPVVRLGMVERDWLSLVISMLDSDPADAESKTLQAFLMRAEQAQRRVEEESVPASLNFRAPRSLTAMPPGELEAWALYYREQGTGNREEERREQGTGNREQERPPGAAQGRRELYWRMAVPLTLVRVSTDLLAMSPEPDPAVRETLRDIQRQSQRLLDILRRYDPQAASEEAPEGTAGPSPAPSE